MSSLSPASTSSDEHVEVHIVPTSVSQRQQFTTTQKCLEVFICVDVYEHRDKCVGACLYI